MAELHDGELLLLLLRLPGGLPGGEGDPVNSPPAPYFPFSTGTRVTVALATNFSFPSRTA